jgi:DNA (cytosine-5)-methyltransferase 1
MRLRKCSTSRNRLRAASVVRGEAAEFFAGIGLVRLALEQAGWRVRYANDIDEDKAEIYRHNWPQEEHLHVGDIHAIRATDLPPVDLFTASFPCNDLSIAGRWDGLDGKESSAFWGLIRLVNELQARKPRLILLENVVGFLQANDSRDFRTALLALGELGYCFDAFILNAWNWTPQSRARLFIVASLDDYQSRLTKVEPSEHRPAALLRFIEANQQLRWNLRRLPRLPRRTLTLDDVVEDLPEDDPHWWNQERVEYFMNQLSPKHELLARMMIALPSISYATAFRRVRHGRSMAELRTDGIAGCLRTPRGGSGRQILFKAGQGRRQIRLLTARECARLQGVGDDYKIDVGLNQALFGFGDAVCVPAVRWIVDNCLTPLMAASARCDRAPTLFC